MKQVVRLNESEFKSLIENKINEYINGIKPSARTEHKNFKLSDLAYEIEYTIEDIVRKGEHLEALMAQTSGQFNDDIFNTVMNFAGLAMSGSEILKTFTGDDYVTDEP